MIRAVRPTDVVALAMFQAQAHATEITAPAWPRLARGRSLASLLRVLARAIAQPTGGRGAWTCLERGRTEALAFTHARAGGLVWDVATLLADSSATLSAARLLDYVAVQAALAGARRVFFDARPDAQGAEIARRAGFDRYASSALYVRQPPHPSDAVDLPGLRPRQRADEHGLFRLYKAAVPIRARAAQAMTCEEWIALQRGRQSWSPAVFSTHQQYVWEREGELAAWIELRRRRRSQHLSMSVHPHYDRCAEDLLRFAIARASPRSPLYLTVWDYQPALARAAEEQGFALVREADCYVRQLPVRVKAPRLVTAKIAGGV